MTLLSVLRSPVAGGATGAAAVPQRTSTTSSGKKTAAGAAGAAQRSATTNAARKQAAGVTTVAQRSAVQVSGQKQGTGTGAGREMRRHG